MAYTAPTTRITGELITASIWNTDLTDSIQALKDPPSDNVELNVGADLTTTSTSFVDITDLTTSLTTKGGDVMVSFKGDVRMSTLAKLYFEIDLDGTPQVGDDGIGAGRPEASPLGSFISFVWLLTGVSAAAHTIKLQWKVEAQTATLYAGAGTSAADVHPQFWAREVS